MIQLNCKFTLVAVGQLILVGTDLFFT